MISFKVFIALFALLLALPTNVMAQFPSTRDGLASECCRLLEQGRYADSVVMTERLHLLCPNDPSSLIVEGTIALHVGDETKATSSFDAALAAAPQDPLAEYGKALSELLANHVSTALDVLNSIDTDAVSEDAQIDILLARAICQTEIGKSGPAVDSVSQVVDPCANELTALVKLRGSPSTSQALLDCLSGSMVDGIPRVIEQPGLRMLLPEDDSGPPIEPSITDPMQQQELADHFDSSFVSAGLRTVTGTLLLSPPRSISPATEYVSLSVDGTVLGMSNTPPYQLGWDSRAFGPGSHTLTFSMFDRTGARVQVQDEDVSVINLDSSAADVDSSLPPNISDRIWNLLRIRPSYKVAEYTVALTCLRSGDADGYETHVLRAAALDPDYRDVRSRIKPLFAGDVPSRFPVPDGTSLPSSLGLSAGSATSAGFWAGSSRVREIALTFDDGPLPAPTKRLLDAMRSVNARGTFFVVGIRAVDSPDSLRQMAADGDCVEDHSFTHPNLTQILPEHILCEILRTAVVIQAATGSWPHFLRPPGGNTNSLVLQTARFCGMSGAFWTIDALPAEESGSAAAVTKWVISRARPGAIVLMHNGMAATADAVPALVQGLREQGYKLVTIRQLAADSLSGGRPRT